MTEDPRLNGFVDSDTHLLPHPGLQDQWHSQPRKLRIIHVGAGATGLCTAYKMERQLTDYELVCYEKNAEIGGTWLENRYWGCACDVPAHIYTYTFEPNPEWKSYYAYSPDIHQYFMNFCEKYQLRKYVKLNHRVVSCHWHEDEGQWEVKIEHDGKIITDWGHILMNGSGFVNKWKWPSIQGLHEFGGKLMHSAAWDQSADLKDKTVAILGTGSSAVQILPQVQKVAKKIQYFMRSNTWISPPMPRVQVDTSSDKDSTADAKSTIAKPVDNLEDPDMDPNVSQYYYKEHEIQKLRDDPEYLLKYRKQIEFGINAGFAIFYKGSEASKAARTYMEASMKARLQNHPELCKRLIPDWSVGCRRLTPGDGYLEALIKPNVNPIYAEIASITEHGLLTEDGEFHQADVVICATGYDMAWTPHFEMFGTDGRRLKDVWSPTPNSYLGVAASGFPNYWVMNGPRGALCNGTVLPCFETQIEYVIQAAKKIQSDRIHSLDVKEEIATSLNRYVDKWQEGSVWSDKCKSWYKNNTVNGKVMCWGGSSIHYLKSIKTPRWEHYNIKYLDNDPWGFLGNGKTKGETEMDFDGMTPYLRNADTPWTIE